MLRRIVTGKGQGDERHLVLKFSCCGQKGYAKKDVSGIKHFHWFQLILFPVEALSMKRGN